ncbi:MAG: hypothetical protein FWC10_02125 [Lentimicrobiaceae bacterium]|nr:hypothetical protein [Lentimicrobiaceae bacterium]
MTDEFLLNEYLNKKQRHKFIEKIPNDTKQIMVTAIMVLSFSEHEDEKTHNEDYKHILGLLKESQTTSAILPELSQIFDNKKKKATTEIEAEKNTLFEQIIGDKLPQYKHLITNNPTDKAEIIEQLKQNCFKDKKNVDLVFRHNTLEKIANSIKFPYVELTVDLLKVKIDNSEETLLLGLSSIIENPKRLSLHNTELESEWKTFPLKWFAHKITQPELRHLFNLHKQGKSLDGYIEKFVSDRMKEITTKFDSHFYPEFANRALLLHNCIHSFEHELYVSSICTALPLIEGSIWAFAEYYNFTEQNLYTEINHQRHLLLTTGNNSKEYTVGDLLKKSNLSDFFDEHFINYYCDELYNERNPILHGKEVNNFNKLNCAKKIMTFDYMTDIMNAYIKEQYFKNMDDLLGTRITEKILNGEALDDADRKEIEEKVTKNDCHVHSQQSLHCLT